MLRLANMIGPMVIKCRHERGWGQEMLVSRLHRARCFISRDVLANIELQRSTVADIVLDALAEAFGIEVSALFPRKHPGFQRPLWPLTPEKPRRRCRRPDDGLLPPD